MKKLSDFLLTVFFCGTLAFVGIKTVYPSVAQIQEVSFQNASVQTSSTVDSIENILKDNLWHKKSWIHLLGILEKLERRHLVGDGQFYKDSDGMMHMSFDEVDYTPLLESIKNTSDYLSTRNIPLLICQTAQRAAYGDTYSSLFDGTTLDYIVPLQEIAENENILYISYPEIFSRSNMTKQDIFFKTDIHYTTSAEFTALSSVVDFFENCPKTKDILHFPNKDSILDLSQYNILNEPFVGNLAKSVGKGYAGIDTFQIYSPKFETIMSMKDSAGNYIKQGAFTDVCMNGYENFYSDEDTYWVTDYMQFTNPFYTIENELVPQNRVLVICDSMAFRTVSYLSLMCHRVTVLDPRYFNDAQNLMTALTQDYDAVIVFASHNLSMGIGQCPPIA